MIMQHYIIDLLYTAVVRAKMAVLGVTNGLFNTRLSRIKGVFGGWGSQLTGGGMEGSTEELALNVTTIGSSLDQ